jgi:hypothetical protein
VTATCKWTAMTRRSAAGITRGMVPFSFPP